MQNKRQASGQRHKEGFLNFYLKYCDNKNAEQSIQFVYQKPDNKKECVGANSCLLTLRI